MPAPVKKKAPQKTDIRKLNLGNIPPQSLEMEASIIGSMLISKDAAALATSMLKPEYFYDQRHEHIFSAIAKLFLNKQPVDSITVVEQLGRDGEIESVGGPAYIAELTATAKSATHVEYYSKIVTQKYLARELIRIALDTQSSAFDEKTDVDELIQRTQGEVFQLGNLNVKREVRQINPYIEEVVKRIQEANKRKEGVSGVPSGFPEVDKVTFGWQKSDLIIIAARPAMGKTAFALSMLKNIAVDGVRGNNGEIVRIPCCMFSLEMSCEQLVNRLVVNVSQIPGNTIRSGQLSNDEWQQLDMAVKKIHDTPIYIDDTPQLSVLELRTKAMRLVSEQHIQIIVIDYLQLMNAQGMNFFSREGEVSLISRSLKGLAKELNIPIIALSQVNRNNEKRDAANSIEGRKPQLSDLRESGAIEQDADIVAFIHRPEYYKIYEDNGKDLRGIAQLLIAKHRNGSTEDIDLRFRKEFAQFSSIAVDQDAGFTGIGEQLIGSRTNPNVVAEEDPNISFPDDFELPPAPTGLTPF